MAFIECFSLVSVDLSSFFQAYIKLIILDHPFRAFSQFTKVIHNFHLRGRGRGTGSTGGFIVSSMGTERGIFESGL